MLRRSSIILFVVTAASAFISSAIAAEDALNAVRAEFRQAYAAGTASNSSDSGALRDYILYPYLQQARLRQALSSAAPDFGFIDREAESFLLAHDKEAVSVELRRAWYPTLVQRQEWTRLLASYRDIGDPVIQCHALTARLTLQRLDNFQQSVVAAWSNSPDSRPACEPAFTWLRTQGVLTNSLIEKRARLALTSNNPAFARQMTALLPQEAAEPLNAWATLIERPRAAIDAAIASPSKPIEAAALLDGWTRLARTDTNGAIQRYKPLVQARALPPEVASRFALEVALPLAWNRRPEALEFFARVRPTELDDRGAEWHARAALWAGNWKRAAAAIEAMSPALKQQTKWRYWAARIDERRGRHGSARAQYANLLKDDNYYAALAAARIKKLYIPQPHALTINDEQVQAIATQPAFARARELLLIDIPELRSQAYEEWRKGYAALDNGARSQSVALAARWSWFDQAILTASQQNLFDDYELLYPHPYDAAVQGAAKIVKLPPSFIYAMLRQESLYRSDAQSAAGAKGLMQLIPDTAKRTLRRWPAIQQAIGDSRDLSNATTNIYIGSANLREMIDRYHGNVALALAAYNAGPLAAERWLPKSKIDIDIWIENIPYNETRVYVQRILWHSVVFGWLASREGQETTQWLGQMDTTK